MPSPFPGMDPYLEQLDWQTFQFQLAAEIARVLAPLVKPKYFVRPEKIYVLSAPGPDLPDRRRPDVSITASGEAGAIPRGTTAVLDAPVQVSVPIPQRLPQFSVKIRDAADRSLVTAIEILSISNKAGAGRKKYLGKRDRFLASQTHLIEIDLQRSGRRMPMAGALPDAPYFVVLSRSDRRPVADVWPISMRSALPVVPIPLGDGDPDVSLDLQSILNSLFAIFSYDAELDYTAPLEKPWSNEDAGWAGEKIRQWRGSAMS
jgi:hypothetical protein